VLALSIVVACLCLVGLYVSSIMLRKHGQGERGELTEPSVVMTATAQATGVPNSLLGLVYYAAVLVMTPFLSHPVIWMIAVVASVLASAFSLYLAYSLLFVTRMPCPFCWTGHIINWLLLMLLIVRR
jgi:uncharacterized membrane protein